MSTLNENEIAAMEAYSNAYCTPAEQHADRLNRVDDLQEENKALKERLEQANMAPVALPSHFNRGPTGRFTRPKNGVIAAQALTAMAEASHDNVWKSGLIVKEFSARLKCECGAEVCGHLSHSTWCPKAEK